MSMTCYKLENQDIRVLMVLHISEFVEPEGQFVYSKCVTIFYLLSPRSMQTLTETEGMVNCE
jgi:hypothetical protein